MVFRVEAYKRPSFEVMFSKDESSVEIGDTLQIEAELVSFTGIKVNQAKVEYRISRIQHFFPRPLYSSYFPQPRRVMIKSGKMQLEGNKIELDIPTGELKGSKGSFSYEIDLNVTDPLGENVQATYTKRDVP